MIEFFVIFGKGGIALWYFQERVSEGLAHFSESINAYIREIVLQQRSDVGQFKYQDMTLKFKFDNELNLVYLVVYQSIVQLSYADKLLTDVKQRFRDLYKNVLEDKQSLYMCGRHHFDDFDDQFNSIMEDNMRATLRATEVVKKPKSFQESAKSQKTVESMIISRPGDKKKEDKKKPANNASAGKVASDESETEIPSIPSSPGSPSDEITKNREALFKRLGGGANKKSPRVSDAPKEEKKKGKQGRVWELQGKTSEALDYSSPTNGVDTGNSERDEQEAKFVEEQRKFVGHSAALKGFDETDTAVADDDDDDKVVTTKSGGWFSAFKGLVGNKQITAQDVEPILEKMKENLIMKNVAAEPADKICQSVGKKLEGKVIGTFSRVGTEVKDAVRESLTQLLTPKRRVDILRDVAEAKKERRPYVIVFCGVNGVGKSTNLAKITFWLNENGHRVLIAAGDTFRAGAVEQLRTHTKHLNALHPNSVQLYEQGYGKDSAGLAAAAITIATERGIDVVLVDTAGRMQDNEPLMRELAKLIRVNEPDLVLFVGEALVGNEAVDQLVKFNQALADNATPGAQPRLIDGIVLTKFDTIDDKVGAAVSMTYITGQPIVFVGCGQTYSDLRNLNAGAVVNALLK